MAGPVTVGRLLAALALPDGCLVDQRVPKTLLSEHGATTAGDKRRIQEGIGEIRWLAVLKPGTVGISPHRDEAREYLEIAVLAVTLRGPGLNPGNRSRLCELIHRAIPYPLFLIMRVGQDLHLSLAHKRLAQNEAGKSVLEGGPVTVPVCDETPTSLAVEDFLLDLALTRRPHRTLLDLYQRWLGSLIALLAAEKTGRYTPAQTPGQVASRHQALRDCERLEREMIRLRAQAGKERQLARQVELNLALQRLRAEQLKLMESL